MANDFESTLAELSRETAQSLHDAAEKLRRSRYKTYRATKTFSLPGIGVELKAGDVVLFDPGASEAEINGVRFPVRLQGPIRIGWIELVRDPK